EVLAAAPGPGRRRVADGLRVLLGLLGLAQFGLGMAQLSAFASVHEHLGLGPADSSHLWHESAAWNVAIGAGFGWIAGRRSRPAGGGGSGSPRPSRQPPGCGCWAASCRPSPPATTRLPNRPRSR